VYPSKDIQGAPMVAPSFRLLVAISTIVNMLDVYYLRKFPRIDKKTKRLVLVSDIGAVEFIQAFNANKGCWAALAAGAFWD
jgi:hypothetical protein